MRPQPGAHGAVANDDSTLGDETGHHLAQRDVRALIDQPGDESLMRIKARNPSTTLQPRRCLADPCARNPQDRRRFSHPEPRRRLPR
jgi:hypothetical protein